MSFVKSKYTIPFVAVLLMVFTLTGCHTTRSTGDVIALTKKQRSDLLAPLAEYPAGVKAITAKTTIVFDNMGSPVTVRGRLRMRRDEVVQMSFTAFGLMEVASVEITPDRAYVIDRVNKRYAVIDYSTGLMNYAGISFSAVQALFWNRIFIPGVKEAWKEADNFTLAGAGTQRLVEPSRQRMLKCKFYTDADCKQLQQTDLALQQYDATWRYGQFETFGAYSCPTAHDVSVSGLPYAIGARMTLTGVSATDTGWSSTTDLSRYKEVDFGQLLSMLNMIK